MYKIDYLCRAVSNREPSARVSKYDEETFESVITQLKKVRDDDPDFFVSAVIPAYAMALAKLDVIEGDRQEELNQRDQWAYEHDVILYCNECNFGIWSERDQSFACKINGVNPKGFCLIDPVDLIEDDSEEEESDIPF